MDAEEDEAHHYWDHTWACEVPENHLLSSRLLPS